MAVTVTVMPRVQTAAKKLPAADARILADFIRLVVLNGINPSSAASTARARSQPVADQDKKLAYTATNELVISSHNRAFYKLSGSVLILTNIVPVQPK